MKFRFAFAFLIILLATLRTTEATEIVVVCPAKFRPAMAPWIAYRNESGLRSTLISPKSDAAQTHQAIMKAADESTAYIVLVGDAPTIGAMTNLNTQVPIHYRPTTVTAAWRSTPTLATDLPYGDLNQDGTPDAAVGRLPVRDEIQLTAHIKKLIAYETSDDFGPWRNEVKLIGGVGGFGMLIDATIESVTRTIVTGVLPNAANTHIRFASPGHAFFPKHTNFTDAVLDDYRSGSRFWVYAGHGQITQLDNVVQSQDAQVRAPVLDRDSAAKLETLPGRWPIALMLACYTGAVDASEDSIVQRMWLSPGGPIAVISGCRVTMPYGNTTAAVGLIDSVYRQRTLTLGDAWLASVRAMRSKNAASAESPGASNARTMIDAMATMVSPPGSDLAEERIEHSQLYNLIGDPTLVLSQPSDITINVEAGYNQGQPITATVNSSIAGMLHLEIEQPLGATVEGDANDRSVIRMNGEIPKGNNHSVSLNPPPGFSGPLVIRAHVEGQQGWASSAAKTIVRQSDR